MPTADVQMTSFRFFRPSPCFMCKDKTNTGKNETNRALFSLRRAEIIGLSACLYNRDNEKD